MTRQINRHINANKRADKLIIDSEAGMLDDFTMSHEEALDELPPPRPNPRRENHER